MAGVGRPPAGDGFAGDAEDLGDLDLGEAELAAPQGAQAERLQDLVGQFARVDDHLAFRREQLADVEECDSL